MTMFGHIAHMTPDPLPLTTVTRIYPDGLTDSGEDPATLTGLRDALLFALRCARAHSKDVASVNGNQRAP
jgi:hypothetical protein